MALITLQPKCPMSVMSAQHVAVVVVAVRRPVARVRVGVAPVVKVRVVKVRAVKVRAAMRRVALRRAVTAPVLTRVLTHVLAHVLTGPVQRVPALKTIIVRRIVQIAPVLSRAVITTLRAQAATTIGRVSVRKIGIGRRAPVASTPCVAR